MFHLGNLIRQQIELSKKKWVAGFLYSCIGTMRRLFLCTALYRQLLASKKTPQHEKKKRTN